MMAYVSSSGYTTIQCSGNYTTTGNTLYPEFWVFAMPNLNQGYVMKVPNNTAEQIAEKFKPVLHKHSYDLQEDLYNFDMVLNNRSTLSAYWLEYDEDKDEYIDHYKEWRGSPLNLEVFSTGYWKYHSYGMEYDTPTEFKLNFDDYIRHAGAPIGQRLLYYHVYRDYGYYYLQYWYFFTMNDLRYHNQTKKKTWHEGDWEHVSIALEENDGNYKPVAVNFYIHSGGQTVYPFNCWWSSSNALSYSGIQQGYDGDHTHLHIWLAANSHSSYNRYELTYQYKLNWQYSGTKIIEDYQDNVDYDPSGYDEYFGYDFLQNLGDACHYENFVLHGHEWDYLTIPQNNAKYWIAFDGRIGDNWTEDIPVYGPIGTPSPGLIATNYEGHEYYYFTQGSSGSHWGNSPPGEVPPFTSGHVYWYPDPSEGD